MMENDFNCIDIETAGSYRLNICQIGLVVVHHAAQSWACSPVSERCPPQQAALLPREPGGRCENSA